MTARFARAFARLFNLSGQIGGVGSVQQAGSFLERDRDVAGEGGAAAAMVAEVVDSVHNYGVGRGYDCGGVWSEAGDSADTADAAAEGGGDACSAISFIADSHRKSRSLRSLARVTPSRPFIAMRAFKA